MYLFDIFKKHDNNELNLKNIFNYLFDFIDHKNPMKSNYFDLFSGY